VARVRRQVGQHSEGFGADGYYFTVPPQLLVEQVQAERGELERRIRLHGALLSLGLVLPKLNGKSTQTPRKLDDVRLAFNGGGA
jgi:hypothetical protein